MSDLIADIANVRKELLERLKKGDAPQTVLRSKELKDLFTALKDLPAEQRASVGRQLNDLRNDILSTGSEANGSDQLSPIDVTAPFDNNLTPAQLAASLLPVQTGSVHPLMSELAKILDIFYRMGFEALQSRLIDDDYHMFGSLNFPEGHPARDDYDTLVTVQRDSNDRPYVAPAHVSTTQNRLQKLYAAKLTAGLPIAAVYTGRIFRKEDLDPRHEHTFYQVEFSYISKDVTASNLVSTIRDWLSSYYAKAIEVKIQPFYFPFTEPSFEFAASCIFCEKEGCSICSYSGWIELGGCGLIHPNVLREGGIDPAVYSGFAGGFGLERMVMLKHGIEDVRLFESGRLDFLRQFS